MKGFTKVRTGAAIAAAGALLTCAATAQAQRPASLGDGAPSGQSGIQLYNFSSYISTGAGELNQPAPPTTLGRIERVFEFLQSKGIKYAELYGYPGNPFPTGSAGSTGNLAGLLELRALGDKYGIRFSGRHGSLTEANWDNQIAASRILGQDHIGEAGLPGGQNAFSSYQAVLNTAQLLNRLGKRSMEAGLGPAYFHNHQPEFERRYLDNGVLKSAWEIVLDHTDPRWVHAQIDIGWSVCGAAGHANPVDPKVGEDYTTAMINKFGRRIVSFHVKDMVNARPSCGNNDQRELGLGDVDFAPMFAAAKNRVKYYLAERDPVGIGGPTNFNPFTNTANSAAALRSAPAPVLQAAPKAFPSVAAGTAAAANQLPITVTNDGDAPLTITAGAIQAEADDGGAATAADFSIVSQNCWGSGTTAVAPAGTCTVNVGFKPTRTNYTSVARLQFTSNSDDAVERVLLAGKSTGDSIASVGGTVPSMLALSIPTQPGSFGTFQPAVARSYETALASTVTSTAGDATLAVSDTAAAFPGHLVNGAFSLPSPLNVRAINASNPAQAFAPLAEATGTPTNLLTYSGPVNGDAVTIGFRQAIGATDVLRSGSYSKTLTFTLSTTAP